jgi:hypothetical protein
MRVFIRPVLNILLFMCRLLQPTTGQSANARVNRIPRQNPSSFLAPSLLGLDLLLPCLFQMGAYYSVAFRRTLDVSRARLETCGRLTTNLFLFFGSICFAASMRVFHFRDDGTSFPSIFSNYPLEHKTTTTKHHIFFGLTDTNKLLQHYPISTLFLLCND